MRRDPEEYRSRLLSQKWLISHYLAVRSGTSMELIIMELKNQNLIDEDTSFSLFESFGKHRDLITNWNKKSLGKKIKKKYSPTVRQFALSLNFFSAKAYAYVRKEFNTILPHVRTLS